MSGVHFSSINHALVSENPSDSINLFWNQQMEKNRANAISFFTPNFDATIGLEYPEFGMFGNNLLNPMLAIQQTMQSFHPIAQSIFYSKHFIIQCLQSDFLFDNPLSLS